MKVSFNLNNLLKQATKRSTKILSEKYNIDNKTFNVKIIDEILYNENTHLVAKFKDYLILDDENEFLNKFYEKSESEILLPFILEYYINYSKINPNYVLNKEGKTIYKNFKKKQKLLLLKHKIRQNKNKVIKIENNNNEKNSEINCKSSNQNTCSIEDYNNFFESELNKINFKDFYNSENQGFNVYENNYEKFFNKEKRIKNKNIIFNNSVVFSILDEICLSESSYFSLNKKSSYESNSETDSKKIKKKILSIKKLYELSNKKNIEKSKENINMQNIKTDNNNTLQNIFYNFNNLNYENNFKILNYSIEDNINFFQSNIKNINLKKKLEKNESKIIIKKKNLLIDIQNETNSKNFNDLDNNFNYNKNINYDFENKQIKNFNINTNDKINRELINDNGKLDISIFRSNLNSEKLKLKNKNILQINLKNNSKLTNDFTNKKIKNKNKKFFGISPIRENSSKIKTKKKILNNNNNNNKNSNPKFINLIKVKKSHNNLRYLNINNINNNVNSDKINTQTYSKSNKNLINYETKFKIFSPLRNINNNINNNLNNKIIIDPCVKNNKKIININLASKSKKKDTINNNNIKMNLNYNNIIANNNLIANNNSISNNNPLSKISEYSKKMDFIMNTVKRLSRNLKKENLPDFISSKNNMKVNPNSNSKYSSNINNNLFSTNSNTINSDKTQTNNFSSFFEKKKFNLEKSKISLVPYYNGDDEVQTDRINVDKKFYEKFKIEKYNTNLGFNKINENLKTEKDDFIMMNKRTLKVI